MRGIAIREELTDEWKKRAVREKREFEIFTAEIAKAAFGITPGKHKKVKGLKLENLRDHMNDLELIFSMLGEAATTEITRVDDARAFTRANMLRARAGKSPARLGKTLSERRGRGLFHEKII